MKSFFHTLPNCSANLIFAIAIVAGIGSTTSADILVTEFFPTTSGSGRILRFDEENFAQSTFAEIPGNPGFSGIVYNPISDKIYASALNFGGIFEFDASGGGAPTFHLLGIGPAGLGVDTAGNIYVTDFTSNLVRIYDPNNFTTPLSTIVVPGGVTTGVGLLSNGTVVIATAGSGVFQYDGVNVTPFTVNPVAPLASSQIAVDPSDNVYVGHAIGFSDLAFKFSSTGSLLGTFEVTDAMVGGTGQGSTNGTSPSGVAIDRNGDIIVAALGKSNPGDPGGERGGLFKFNSSGTSFTEIVTASKAFSAVTIVPKATVFKTFVFHPAWAGSGSSTDAGKVVHLETASPKELGDENLLNSMGGVRGIGFQVRDFADWGNVSLNDFEFRMSPQGAFIPGDHPPSGWQAAPNPLSIQLVSGSPDEIRLTWINNQVVNRWLRITLKATPATGLLAPRVYYIGHLLGETSGASDGVYTVSFQDISLIRGQVGSSTSSDSIVDINKNGVVSFSDISDMRSAVGTQLPVISVP
jgi:hypothetical protein